MKYVLITKEAFFTRAGTFYPHNFRFLSLCLDEVINLRNSGGVRDGSRPRILVAAGKIAENLKECSKPFSTLEKVFILSAPT